jgi:hypothetical protein
MIVDGLLGCRERSLLEDMGGRRLLRQEIGKRVSEWGKRFLFF